MLAYAIFHNFYLYNYKVVLYLKKSLEIEQNSRETEEIRVWSSFEVEGGSRVAKVLELEL